MLPQSWLGLERTVKCSPVLLRLVLAISCTVFPGCASLGVVPHQSDKNFNDSAQETCLEQHGSSVNNELQVDKGAKEYKACLEYERAAQWGNELKEAYRARSSMNRYAIWISGAIALGAVGSLAGLGAFSLAGSDAAKIIPLAAGFVGGLFGLSQNSGKADAYTKATEGISNALVTANGIIRQTGRTEISYGAAQGILVESIAKSQIDLDKAKMGLTPKEQMLLNETEQLQKKVDLLEAAETFKDVKVKAVTFDSATNQMKITFEEKVDLPELKYNDIEIQVAGEKSTVLTWSKDIVALFPEKIKEKAGPHPVQVIIKGHSIQPITPLTIP